MPLMGEKSKTRLKPTSRGTLPYAFSIVSRGVAILNSLCYWCGIPDLNRSQNTWCDLPESNRDAVKREIFLPLEFSLPIQFCGLDYTLTIAFALGPRRLVSTRSKILLSRLRSVLAFYSLHRI